MVDRTGARHTGVKDVDRSENFEPLVVIHFATNAKQPAIEWILAKIQGSRQSGGAALTVRAVTKQLNEGDKDTMLYVGASIERLLLAAEMMEIKKLYVDGYHREFSVKDVGNFRGSGDLDNFFSMADKQKIILHELENIRAQESDQHIPGYENIKLYPGKSIVKKYQSRDIVTHVFPLHEPETLKRIGGGWFSLRKWVSSQPLDNIRDYFGEKIALYFAFLGFYTIALIPPAVIGILYYITSWKSVYREAIFALFNLIWATVFLESWKRYSSELSFKWGTIDMVSTKFEEPRVNFYGTMGKNPVTGKPEPVYPKWKRILRFYGVTVPVIGSFLALAFYLMLLYFWTQARVDRRYAGDNSWENYVLVYMPTVVYAVIIAVVNMIYRRVAKKLNDWENHRLQSSYENHLIVKLILFDFVNCFISLFYVAFYMQNMKVLYSDLAALLITQQILGQMLEMVLPFLLFRNRRRKQVDKVKKLAESTQKVEYYSEEVGETTQHQASLEATMDVYDSTMDDYLEMFLQFGYVSLFSSSFPLAAVWALVNNITEIRSDAFKMCNVFQRPFAESASGMGAWQMAFELTSVMAVITNSALIAMDPQIQSLLPSSLTPVNMLLIFVAMEHVVLAVKIAVAQLIPDSPRWVQIETAKMAYQSKQALIKERLDAAASGQSFLHQLISHEAKAKST